MVNCPNCHAEVAEGTARCPQCGYVLTGGDKKSTQVIVEQHVGEVQSGEVIGVQIGQVSGAVTVGYSSQDVQALLTKISASFQPKPFDGKCPYVGLESFQEEDADRFFGRENLVADLQGRIQHANFILVTGPSGSGKSSLVRAGLLPALKGGLLPGSERWLYATLKPGRDPLEALGRATASLTATLTAADDIHVKSMQDNTVLSRWIEVALGDRRERRAVLFIDQFEEVFTQVSDNAEPVRQAFIHLLEYAAAAADSRAVLLLTMRSDFISNCAAYPGLNALINQQFLQVGTMSPEDLVNSIARPALQVGLRIDPDLVAQIIADMEDEPGALPLMQFALKDLFDARAQAGGVIALTKEDYLARGGLHKALQRYADSAFSQLTSHEQELARTVFEGLVQPGKGTQDTRRTALFSELVPANDNKEDVVEVIRKLADARLVTTEELGTTPGDDRAVTLAHERLLEAWPWLSRLVNENRETIALQNEIQEDGLRWERNERDESYLYTGARLETARERLDEKKLVLTGLGAEFVQASIAHREAELRTEQEERDAEQRRELEAAQRVAEAERLRAGEQAQSAKRVRRWAIGLAAVAVIALLFAVMAVLAQQAANRNAVDAANKGATATFALGLSLQRGTEAAAQKATAEYNAGVAEQNAQEAQSQTRLALARQFASQSLTDLLAGSVDTALLLGVHAIRTEDTPQSENSLLTALQVYPRMLRILTGHADTVNVVEYSPDGQTLASAGCRVRNLSREVCLEGDLRLWDTRSGQTIGKPFQGLDDEVTALAFNPDGGMLASGNQKGDIQFWDVASQKVIAALESGYKKQVDRIVFSADGQFIYTHAQDSPWKKWAVNTLQEIAPVFAGIPAAQSVVTISPGGRKLLTQAGDQLSLWDTDSPQAGIPITPTLPAESWIFNAGSTRLASANRQGIQVFDTTGTSILNCPFNSPFLDSNFSLAFAPDGKTLAYADRRNKLIYFWDVSALNSSNNNNCVLVNEPISGHTDTIATIAFSPDGRTLASGSRDKTIRLWDWNALPSLGIPLANQREQIFDLVISPDGKYLLYGSCNQNNESGDGCKQGKVVVLDAASGQPAGDPLIGHTDNINSIAVSPDGKLLATGSWDKTILIWDFASRKPVLGPLLGHTDFVTGLDFSPDGKTLVSTSRDQTIRRWDVATGEPVGNPLTGQKDFITTIAYSPQGDMIASGSRDQAATLLLWDLSSTSPISYTLQGHREQVHTVLFSPDGKTLASSGADGLVILWDVASRTMRHMLTGHTDRATGLGFSPDGKLIASGGWDSKVIIWDTASGQQIGSPLGGHTDFVNNVDFIGDGSMLVSSSRDGLLLVWDFNPVRWIKKACSIVARDFSTQEWKKYVGDQIPFEPVCQ